MDTPSRQPSSVARKLKLHPTGLMMVIVPPTPRPRLQLSGLEGRKRVDIKGVKSVLVGTT